MRDNGKVAAFISPLRADHPDTPTIDTACVGDGQAWMDWESWIDQERELDNILHDYPDG